MPKIGDVKSGYEVGRNTRVKYIYARCPNCGELRWTCKLNNKARHSKCKICAGEESAKKSPHYRGGKTKISGYSFTKLQKDDKFFPLVGIKGYVKDCRLVAANVLLLWGFSVKEIIKIIKDNIIHHRDEDTSNDAPENLEIISIQKHTSIHSINRKNKENLAMREFYFHSKDINPDCSYSCWYDYRNCTNCGKVRLVAIKSRAEKCNSCANNGNRQIYKERKKEIS